MRDLGKEGDAPSCEEMVEEKEEVAKGEVTMLFKAVSSK